MSVFIAWMIVIWLLFLPVRIMMRHARHTAAPPVQVIVVQPGPTPAAVRNQYSKPFNAEERAATQDHWWREHILPELFEYRDRVTFLYGQERAAGCTVEELTQRAEPAMKSAGNW